MENQLSVFRKFASIEQAREIISFLNSKNIETELTNNIAPVDNIMLGNSLNQEFEVKIKLSDFDNANKLLEKMADDQISTIDNDYYLFEFSDDELYDIILKQDEWNEFDYSLAKKLLSQRGKPIDDNLIKVLRNKRLEELSKTEENQKPWIIAGYIFAFFGGFLGLIIGYVLMTSKKNLPNGQRIHSYNNVDRKHGKTIFYIGIVMLPFYVLFKILLTK